MKKIQIIGPVPPPIHGESMAINSIITSTTINDKFGITVINTNRKKVDKAGKFQLLKVIQDLKILHLVKKQKNDISYISISQTKLGLLRDLLIIYFASKTSKKIITHLHGNNLGNTIDNFPVLLNRFKKSILRKVDIGIVLGDNLKNNYRNLVEDVRIVHNGVPEDFISDDDFDFATNSRKNKDVVQVLYLSNLIESKGFLILSKAISNLVKKGYKVKLVLAGAIHDNENYEELLKLIKENNLENYITYRGLIVGDEKKQLLLESDIMVLPTSYKIEGQPLSLIEGMAAGLPIISTDIGCIGEMVKNNGILIDDNPTITKVENALTILLENNIGRYKSSLESRLLYKKNYTLSNYILNLVNIFNED